MVKDINKAFMDLHDTVNMKIKEEKRYSYMDGFNTGIDIGFEIGNSFEAIKNIDYDSIKVFSEWCYINGVDFSYMRKATDTESFVERVIKKFKIEMEENNKNDCINCSNE